MQLLLRGATALSLVALAAGTCQFQISPQPIRGVTMGDDG